jgi:hypothetical protein
VNFLVFKVLLSQNATCSDRYPPASPTAAPNALSRLKPSGGVVARMRVGGGKASWAPIPLQQLPNFGIPVVVVEKALPAAVADALLAELLNEGMQSWGQDEWWIAGEARLAPRLTAIYELHDDDAMVAVQERTQGDAGEDDAAADDDAMAEMREETQGEDDDDNRSPRRRASANMRAAAVRACNAATVALINGGWGGGGGGGGGATQGLQYGQTVVSGERWTPTYAVGNLYRTGADRVGPHADRLTSLGPLPTIVGLSLGACRTFRVRKRWPLCADGSDDITVDIPLPHNSFCIMLPPCQELWTHEVVREGGPLQGGGKPPRVSLTFRRRIEEWAARAPTCECGRQCVLKTRRADQPPPAFAVAAAAAAAAAAGKVMKPPGSQSGPTDHQSPAANATAAVNAAAVKADGDDDGSAGGRRETGKEAEEKTPVMYYYTCDTVNGGQPCKFYSPLETRML